MNTDISTLLISAHIACAASLVVIRLKVEGRLKMEGRLKVEGSLCSIEKEDLKRSSVCSCCTRRTRSFSPSFHQLHCERRSASETPAVMHVGTGSQVQWGNCTQLRLQPQRMVNRLRAGSPSSETYVRPFHQPKPTSPDSQMHPPSMGQRS